METSFMSFKRVLTLLKSTCRNVDYRKDNIIKYKVNNNKSSV